MISKTNSITVLIVFLGALYYISASNAADDEKTITLEEKIKFGITEFFSAFANENTKKMHNSTS